MARLGLYIHYPYCRRRCDYCDFAIAVISNRSPPDRRYRDAVLAELESRAAAFAGRDLVSVYFGGGTPSLWDPVELSAVLRRALGIFAASGPLEVTLEANPVDCTAETLAAWREAGINRLSVGIQSLSGRELAVLGRDQSMGAGPEAIAAAREAGFESLSADVIIGTPTSRSAGLDSLERVADLPLDHLSVYELTFEDNAPLGRAAARGEVEPRTDDELAELYERAERLLRGRGFEHYEISSYARPGARAIHNSLYWQGAEYLGVGSSAASLRIDADGSAVRETNHRSAARYLSSAADQTVAEREPIAAEDAARERLWLAMRTSDGAPVQAFDGRAELVSWLLDGGLASAVGDRIQPTRKGFLYANQVAAKVVGYP